MLALCTAIKGRHWGVARRPPLAHLKSPCFIAAGKELCPRLGGDAVRGGSGTRWPLRSGAGRPQGHKYSQRGQGWLGFDRGLAGELLLGSLSFSVCVKHFPESKFCYGKTIYHTPPHSADTPSRSCQHALTAG